MEFYLVVVIWIVLRPLSRRAIFAHSGVQVNPLQSQCPLVALKEFSNKSLSESYHMALYQIKCYIHYVYYSQWC